MLRRNILALMLLYTSVAFAQPISQEQAYQNAIQFLADGQSAQRAQSRNVQTLQLAYKAQTRNNDDLYIYNRNGGGFVIVSADARTVRPVLGYSYQGHFDAGNIPPSLEDILSEYQQQIQYARKNIEPADNLLSDHEPVGKVIVEPLIKTSWDQDAPYNELCPMDDGRKTYAGCVAAAMAQIMKYWRWPERGRGSHTNINGDSLYVDFSKSVYDWDNMPIAISADTPQIKQYAVQKLLYDCGMATNMQYSINGTYLDFIPRAMMAYFDYSSQAHEVTRSDFKDGWDDMIKQELDASRPVLMGGGGHAYICDGYDSLNYFHYNLGWSGYNDGFFLSDAIKRDNGYDNFSKNQEAIIGIYPDYNDECKDGMALCRLNDSGIAELCDLVWSKDTFDIVIPDSTLIDGKMYPIRSIPDNAFHDGKYSVYGNLTLPETLESIGIFAFLNCRTIQELHIPASVKYIAPGALCTNEIKTVTVDESSPYYYSPEGSNVIIERSNRRLVQTFNNSVIPPHEEIIIIGENAFYEDDSIVSIKLPEDVTIIEDDAFANSTLKEIHLGPKLTTIGKRVFESCPNLTDVYCYSVTPPSLPSSAFTTICTVHVKPSALESYKEKNYWKKHTIVADIPETTDVPQMGTPTPEPQYYDLMGRPVQQGYKGVKVSGQGKSVICQ